VEHAAIHTDEQFRADVWPIDNRRGGDGLTGGNRRFEGTEQWKVH
jgi:hypothetical protein